MHENREISCTSCSKEEDRSAKAINRTADMYVQEKSDCAVVPVNQSNKEAQASEEPGEGRAQTKENIVQLHKLPTQSGEGLSQGLSGVRQAARIGSRNGSPLCSTTSTSDSFATAFTHSSVKPRRESME
jgi:hypothetical protein